MTRYACLLLSLCLALGCSPCFAQGGNCEPPTPEELARMQEMRRSPVAPATEVRMGGSKFRGTSRKPVPMKPVPTAQERALHERIRVLQERLDAVLKQLPPQPRPADNRTWTAQEWADYVDENHVLGAGG